MREELVTVVAENLRPRGDMDGKDEELAAMAADSRRWRPRRKGRARSAMR